MSESCVSSSVFSMADCEGSTGGGRMRVDMVSCWIGVDLGGTETVLSRSPVLGTSTCMPYHPSCPGATCSLARWSVARRTAEA